MKITGHLVADIPAALMDLGARRDHQLARLDTMKKAVRTSDLAEHLILAGYEGEPTELAQRIGAIIREKSSAPFINFIGGAVPQWDQWEWSLPPDYKGP